MYFMKMLKCVHSTIAGKNTYSFMHMTLLLTQIIFIVGNNQQERMRVNDYLYPRLEIRNFIEEYTTEQLIPGIN